MKKNTPTTPSLTVKISFCIKRHVFMSNRYENFITLQFSSSRPDVYSNAHNINSQIGAPKGVHRCEPPPTLAHFFKYTPSPSFFFFF